MAQVQRLLPILFTLNNTVDTRDVVKCAFGILDYLFLSEESTAISVLKSIDIFSVEEFRMLHKRIMNVRNKVVDMNEKHLIIFYGVLHIIDKTLNSEVDVKYLRDDEDRGFNHFLSPEIMTYFLKTANKFMDEIKSSYNKNHYIARSIAKIDNC